MSAGQDRIGFIEAVAAHRASPPAPDVIYNEPGELTEDVAEAVSDFELLWKCRDCNVRVEPAHGSVGRGWRTVCRDCVQKLGIVLPSDGKG